MYPVGPKRDHTIFHGTRMRHSSTPDQAKYVICTGLFDDEVETPDDYRDRLARPAGAQPVRCLRQSRHRGRARRPPGLLRRRASRCPMRRSAARCTTPASRTDPLYDMALGEIARARTERSLGGDVPRNRVLAIGDSVRTDLKGAHDLRRRLPVRHRRHSRRGARPPRRSGSRAALATISSAAGKAPKAVTRKLVW